MSHLGERLTALVDGELGHDERDRALAHLAACEQCRREADTLRRLKSRLRALDDVATPTALIGRLYGLDPGQNGPAGPRESRLGGPGTREPTREPWPLPAATRPIAVVPGVQAVQAVPADRRRRPGDNRPGGRAVTRDGRPRVRYLVAGAATLAVLGVGAASFVAGTDEQRLPQVAPAFDRFAVEHALISGEVPMTEPSPAKP
ncbi:MAG: putative transrane anti-sigma factor [Streptosporangiaceae bacterium]|jgi:anti-sigma factor RsiW|nr:putative transrane anti-sigma factor [Streptosporangiaceae bacterium]